MPTNTYAPPRRFSSVLYWLAPAAIFSTFYMLSIGTRFVNSPHPLLTSIVVVIVTAVLAVIIRWAIPYSNTFHRTLNTPTKLRIGLYVLVCAVAIWVVGQIITNHFAAQLYQFNPHIFDNWTQENASKQTLPWYVAAFISVVATPICEEIIFRFGIFRLFECVTPPVTAAVISTILFVYLHSHPLAFVYAGGLGLINCFIYYHTRRIIYPIIIHGVFNTMSMVLPTVTVSAHNAVATLVVLVVSVLFLSVFLELIHTDTKK